MTDDSPAVTGSAVERSAVYLTGVVQGLVLVTFPAASTIFTSASGYGLSRSAYGDMFVPQVVLAIVMSLAGPAIGRRVSAKGVYLAGLVSSVVAMALLLASWGLTADRAAAYVVLLVATGFVGAGFGLTVPAINAFTADFHPRAVDRSVLVLNALLGLGTALAPVFVAIFDGAGAWWGLPIVAVVLLVALLAVTSRCPLRAAAPVSGATASATDSSGSRLPRRFAVYAAAALAYGICETMSGNWSQIVMTSDVHVSATAASFALTAFWAVVTDGRVVFAVVQRVVPARWTYRVLPVVIAAGSALVLVLPTGNATLGILDFALIGLGCSAILPLTLSFGQEEFTRAPAVAAGAIVAFYQAGYGVAAFGVGPLRSAGVDLADSFGITAAVAVGLAGLALVLVRRRREPQRLHPHPHPSSRTATSRA